MKYEIRYRRMGTKCCKDKPSPSTKIHIYADNPEEAKKALLKKLPDAMIDTVTEV